MMCAPDAQKTRVMLKFYEKNIIYFSSFICNRVILF